jgi:hypothetical protein
MLWDGGGFRPSTAVPSERQDLSFEMSGDGLGFSSLTHSGGFFLTGDPQYWFPFGHCQGMLRGRDPPAGVSATVGIRAGEPKDLKEKR